MTIDERDINAIHDQVGSQHLQEWTWNETEVYISGKIENRFDEQGVTIDHYKTYWEKRGQIPHLEW